jgi:hypothetical protein
MLAQKLQSNELINYSFILNGNDNNEFLTSGTGSIVKYNERYYLVTNYHVLSGIDNRTKEKFPELKNTTNAISVIFQPADKRSPFIVMIYQLYQPNGEPNFETLTFQDQILDISVLPIVLPVNAAKYYFEVDNIDTSLIYKNNDKLRIVGFPKGQFLNGWQPSILEVNAVSNFERGPNIFDPFVFFDQAPIKGLSGSPVFKINPDGTIKVLSVVTNVVDPPIKEAPTIKGRSIYLAYAIDLISKIEKANKPPIIGFTL